MKRTILIFGVSSFVGSNLLEVLKNDFRIIGTYHHTPVTIPGVTCIPCDVLKKEYVSSLVARFRPDICIYAAGLSSLKECSLNQKKSDALNSSAAMNCCTASERHDAKFIYISSGFVLAGEDTLYREGETPFPNTVYGNSLSSTEFHIQRSSLNYLIFRCSPLYGRSFSPTHPNWFEYLESSLAKNETIDVDDSVVTGFLDVKLMVNILKVVIDLDVKNRLLHVSSSDFMTRYEFAKLYARIFKKDENLVQKVPGTFPLDKNRSHSEKSNYYFKLNTFNIESMTGIKMPTVETSLNLTRKRLGLES
jgi:dTDP-4-dehydrorhamnose reductase